MATLDTLASQVTALHREVRDLHGQLERVLAKLDTLSHTPEAVVVSDERGTFIPGTGWTGVQSTPPPHDEALDRDAGLERIRATREALRHE